jgi:hypothetical protein
MTRAETGNVQTEREKARFLKKSLFAALAR